MKQDVLLRGLLADSTVRFIAVSAPALVEEARSLHGLSRVCTAALGRTLMAAAMMGVQLKSEQDRLTVILKGGGPAGNMVCTARADGVVKGYIENPALELPPTPNGKLDVSGAVGRDGELTVVRDMGLKEPYVGRCELASGEIAEDFARYFTQSEQQPSLVYLGVRVRPADGETLAAGGLILQPLPDCPDSVLDALQEKALGIGALSGMLEEGALLEEALGRLFAGMDMEITQRTQARFLCDCSRERLEKVLISLGKSELEDMIERDGGAELTCQFCNKKYAFDRPALETLLAEASAGAR